MRVSLADMVRLVDQIAITATSRELSCDTVEFVVQKTGCVARQH
jgi:hypothetical protein